MATLGVLKRKKLQVKRLHGIMEMRIVKFNETKMQEDLDEYYIAYDKLDLKLDEYYADSIMFMKDNKPDLYDLYMGLNKQTVKVKMLRQIVNRKQSEVANKLIIHRIKNMKEERIKLLKLKNKPKLKILDSKLRRLEAWAKDINY